MNERFIFYYLFNAVFFDIISEIFFFFSFTNEMHFACNYFLKTSFEEFRYSFFIGFYVASFFLLKIAFVYDCIVIALIFKL